jgi:pimeloyl-ACP methyl ester carboxylesterase
MSSGLNRVRHYAMFGMALLMFAGLSVAQAELLQVPTGRGDTVPVYWDKVPGATITVFLFNGGNGYVPFNAKGMPRGQNFLLKSYPLFAAKATNVVVVGTREAVPQMSDAYRVNEHPADIRAIAKAIQERSNAPIWLVGTSRGTVSVVAAANGDSEKLYAGIVLTSSFVEPKNPLTVVRLDVDKIKIPVLVYHHAADGCRAAKPADAEWAAKRFTNAPIRKFVKVSGGDEVDGGDPCSSGHHTFIGMEEQAVSDIVGWINNPQN